MKALRVILLMVVALSLVYTNGYAKEVKMGYVDLSKLFDEYHKTKAYDVVLEEKHKSFQSARNEKIEAIRDAQGKLGLLKEDKKADLEKEIEDLKAELLEYDQKEQQDLTKDRNEKIREILLEIEKVVRDYAEKDGFDVILNDKVLIYGADSLNLTEPILKKLNEEK